MRCLGPILKRLYVESGPLALQLGTVYCCVSLHYVESVAVCFHELGWRKEVVNRYMALDDRGRCGCYKDVSAVVFSHMSHSVANWIGTPTK
jgi:hypothetical protein